MTEATDLPTIRAALEDSFAAMETLGAELRPGEWEARSLCPEWTVRDVFDHVAGVERVLEAWTPENDTTPPPFDRLRAFTEETAGADPSAFMERVHAVFESRRRDLAALTPADFERPSWMPVGPGTYGRFMEIRVFDIWMHERDVAVPLRRPTDDTGTRAEISLAEVEGALGYIVGKKIGLPNGWSIVFHLSGPLQRDLPVLVEGRAAVVDAVAAPDVELFTDTLTFMLLAGGRIDPQGPIDSGAVRWSGDGEFGERAARNLRFTI